ncbi:MAG: sugar phosphate isomerase/epimerase [Anaerolineae bacterium]|nr:sugar phosphate isomerase/epimerase [Anaerolineae bacterium]
MVYLRGNSISFHAYPAEEACQRIVAAGCNSVEMWKDHLSGFKTPALLAHFREFAADLGLSLWGLNVVGADYFHPFESGASYDRTLAGLKEDVDYALELGVREVMVWEGAHPGIKISHVELLDTLTHLFQAAIDYARPNGVRFLAEPHPFTLGMDLDFVCQLCDRLGRDHFGILFDFCHFGVGKPDGYVEAIHTLGDRIQHLHYADSDRVSSELHFPPGKGTLDLAAMDKALQDVGFKGSATLDMYGYPLPEQGYRWGLPRFQIALEALGIEGQTA